MKKDASLIKLNSNDMVKIDILPGIEVNWLLSTEMYCRNNVLARISHTSYYKVNEMLR